MLKVRRLLAKRVVLPVQIPHPPVQMRIPAADVPDVTFEMLHVDGVEAYDGREETDVGLGDGRRGEEVWRGRLCEGGLDAVEGCEERGDGFGVGFGGAGGGVRHRIYVDAGGMDQEVEIDE